MTGSRAATQQRMTQPAARPGASGTVRVRRALLSVSDKTGLVAFAAALHARGVELISTGGTHAALADAGIAAIEVSAVTGFPEIMAGRVKTLHPRIHGALLARTVIDDAVLAEHAIAPIDLVVVNLYPFERTIAAPDVDDAGAIEQIDIGGPAMTRAAAKNHDRVLVVTAPEDYPRVLAEIEALGGTSWALRRAMAQLAFARTAAYDAAIAAYLLGQPDRF